MVKMLAQITVEFSPEVTYQKLGILGQTKPKSDTKIGSI